MEELGHRGTFRLSLFPNFSTSVRIAMQWTKTKAAPTLGLRGSQACGGSIRPVWAKARAGNPQ
jgi:hypothetical protein